jgi:hypothetical protein
MKTTIKLTAGLKKIVNPELPSRVGFDHCYFMEIVQEKTDRPHTTHNVVKFTFQGGELGWLQAQTTLDNFKDSLTPVAVIDETSDPR